MADETAASIIRDLNLTPHPEGGHYRETFRDVRPDGSRGDVTSIYYLLAAGEQSHWHKVDATEIWCHHAGSGFELHLSADGMVTETHFLGTDLANGQVPQITIPKGWWQAARPLGPWSLAGCIVAPAFRFGGFALAPKNWEPGKLLP